MATVFRHEVVQTVNGAVVNKFTRVPAAPPENAAARGPQWRCPSSIPGPSSAPSQQYSSNSTAAPQTSSVHPAARPSHISHQRSSTTEEVVPEWISLDEAEVLYARLGLIPSFEDFVAEREIERKKNAEKWRALLYQPKPKVRPRPLETLLEKPKTNMSENVLNALKDIPLASTTLLSPVSEDDQSLPSRFQSSPPVVGSSSRAPLTFDPAISPQPVSSFTGVIAPDTNAKRISPSISINPSSSRPQSLPSPSSSQVPSLPSSHVSLPLTPVPSVPSSLIPCPPSPEIICLDSPCPQDEICDDSDELPSTNPVTIVHPAVLDIPVQLEEKCFKSNIKRELKSEDKSIIKTEAVRVLDGKEYPVIESNDIILPIPPRLPSVPLSSPPQVYAVVLDEPEKSDNNSHDKNRTLNLRIVPLHREKATDTEEVFSKKLPENINDITRKEGSQLEVSPASIVKESSVTKKNTIDGKDADSSSKQDKFIQLFGEDPFANQSKACLSLKNTVELVEVIKDPKIKKRKKHKDKEHKRKRSKHSVHIFDPPKNLPAVIPLGNGNDIIPETNGEKELFIKPIGETKSPEGKNGSAQKRTVTEFDMFANVDAEKIKKARLLKREKRRKSHESRIRRKEQQLKNGCVVLLQRVKLFDCMALHNIPRTVYITEAIEALSRPYSLSSSPTVTANDKLPSDENEGITPESRVDSSWNVDSTSSSPPLPSVVNTVMQSPIKKPVENNLTVNIPTHKVTRIQLVEVNTNVTRKDNKGEIEERSRSSPEKAKKSRPNEDVQNVKMCEDDKVNAVDKGTLCVISSPRTLFSEPEDKVRSVEPEPVRRWNLNSFMVAKQVTTIARDSGDVVIASTVCSVVPPKPNAVGTEKDFTLSTLKDPKIGTAENVASISPESNTAPSVLQTLPIEHRQSLTASVVNRVDKSKPKENTHLEALKASNGVSVTLTTKPKDSPEQLDKVSPPEISSVKASSAPLLSSEKPYLKPVPVARHTGLPIVTPAVPHSIIRTSTSLSLKNAIKRNVLGVSVTSNDNKSVSTDTLSVKEQPLISDGCVEMSTSPPKQPADVRLKNATYCGISREMLLKRRPSTDAIDATTAFLRGQTLLMPDFKEYMCDKCDHIFNEHLRWVEHITSCHAIRPPRNLPTSENVNNRAAATNASESVPQPSSSIPSSIPASWTSLADIPLPTVTRPITTVTTKDSLS